MSNLSSSELQNFSNVFKGIVVSYQAIPKKSDSDINAMTPNDQTSYYAQLKSVNKSLHQYIDKLSTVITVSENTLMNEERYETRIHPEETISQRDIVNGFFPKFRVSSIPYVLTAGVFMSLLSLFLIFNLLQPSLSGIMIFTSPAGSLPFYKNPMILSGFITILVVALIVFIILYFQKKK